MYRDPLADENKLRKNQNNLRKLISNTFAKGYL